MEQIKCIIVDDEPLALDILEDYIKKIPFISLVHKCNNAIEALHVFNREKIDILFIDIEMPDISGIQLVKSLKTKPLVVFTTAHQEYALEGYNLDAIDYLLKPIEFGRFFKTATKAFNLLHPEKTEVTVSAEKKEQDFLFVRSNYKLIRVNISDILFIEGLNDYIKIHTKNKALVTLMTLKAIEEKLPEDKFIRVHRSFIVSIEKIDSVSNHRISLDNHFIPISAPYREYFYFLLKKFS